MLVHACERGRERVCVCACVLVYSTYVCERVCVSVGVGVLRVCVCVDEWNKAAREKASEIATGERVYVCVRMSVCGCEYNYEWSTTAREKDSEIAGNVCVRERHIH